MSIPIVSINLVVLNGEKYIRHCLDGILTQTYQHDSIEFNILDNGSSDSTKSIIENFKLKIENSNFSAFNFIKSDKNWGMWPGQEELLKYSSGKYILAMAVDVILDKDFVKNAVEILEKDPKIGALQAKIYKFDLPSLQVYGFMGLQTETIDTCGFQIFKSRRIINIGHGELDVGQFTEQKEIFGVEGACPFFRKTALENCRIPTSMSTSKDYAIAEVVDHDYFWYGDDLDLAWRMSLFGWKQIFSPVVVAWHDRQTTKSLGGNFKNFLAIRKTISLRKRQLEWKNIRWTIIKNDYIINILRDLPYILKREILMLGYLIFFEPKVLLEIPAFLGLLPKMLKKRKEIMRKAIVKPNEIKKWFIGITL